MRWAESAAEGAGADVLAHAGGLELEAGGDLHVAGDDAEVEVLQAAQLAHQLGDAGQRPYLGGTLRNGGFVALF